MKAKYLLKGFYGMLAHYLQNSERFDKSLASMLRNATRVKESSLLKKSLKALKLEAARRKNVFKRF